MNDGIQLNLLCRPEMQTTLRDMIWDLICARPGVHKEELADELQIHERMVRRIIHDMRVDPHEKRLVGACDGYYPIRTEQEFTIWRDQERRRWWSLMLIWYTQTKKAAVKFEILGEDLFKICENDIEIELRELGTRNAELETKRGE